MIKFYGIYQQHNRWWYRGDVNTMMVAAETEVVEYPFDGRKKNGGAVNDEADCKCD